MIERADIEGSKSNVAMNACAVPHASYACGVGKGKAGPEMHLRVTGCGVIHLTLCLKIGCLSTLTHL